MVAMMMKGLIYMTIFGLGTFPSRDNDKLEFIEVRKIPFQLMMPLGISCVDFEVRAQSYFPDTFYMTSLQHQQRVLESIRDSRVAKEYKPDTRAKLILTYTSGRKDSLCIGSTEAFLMNGRGMIFEKRDLIDFIDSLPTLNYNRHRSKHR